MVRTFLLSIALALLASTGAALPHYVDLYNFPAVDPFIDTVRFVQWQLDDQDFYDDGELRELQLLSNVADKVVYKLWMQPEPAPLVFILPGLGGHFANEQPNAMAELLYRNGFSVAILCNAFNWEFVLSASRTAAPGYTPDDARDTYAVMQRICEDIGTEYGFHRITSRELVGYSLGALHTLFIADLDAREHKIGFDRYLALSPPVNLLYGLRELDEMYKIWTNWSEAKIEKSRNDAVDIYRTYFDGEEGHTITNNIVFDITSDEARFAIGYTFRRTLQEVLLAIHSRTNFGVLQHDMANFNRRHLYEELERFSYYNYLCTFLQAAYPDLGRVPEDLRRLNAECSLFALQPMLQQNRKIRVFHTADDFLLTDYDRDWLSGVLDDRLTIYSHGGHLGYLYRKEVQQDIVNALHGTAGTGSGMLYAQAQPAPPAPPAESAQPAQPAAARQAGFVPAPQAAEPVVTPIAPTPVAAPAKDDAAKTLAPSPDVITEPDAVPLHGSDIMRQERATARRAAAEPTIAGDTNTAQAVELEAQAPAETDVVVIEETGSPAPFALGDMPEQPGEAASDASHDTAPTPPREPPDDLGQRSDVIIEFRDE